MSPARRRAVLAALALLGALHAASFVGTGPVDDDYIVYRYARNWLAGEGLVFNPGEVVEGFTVPLWVFVHAAGLALDLEPTLVSIVVSVLAAGAAVWAVGAAWYELRPEARVPGPALLLAVCSPFMLHAILGLGTVPLAAMLAAWLAAWCRSERAGRPAWAAALWLGAAGLMRAEAVLWAAPFALVEVRRSGKRGSVAALALVPVLAWTLFRRAYYGKWLPVSYLVKKLPFFEDLRYGVAYLGIGTLATGTGLLLLISLGVWVAPRVRRLPVHVALAGALLHTAYVVYVGGDFLPGGRFLLPALPLLLVTAGLGFERIAGGRRAVLIGGTLVLALAYQWPQFVLRPLMREVHQGAEVRWEAMGRDFAERFPPGTRVALAPIGAVGWESGLPIVDLLGLVNDQVWRAEPDLSIRVKGHHRHDAEWVFRTEPEVIVLGNGWTEDASRDGPRVTASAWEGPLVLDPRLAEGWRWVEIDVLDSGPLVFLLRRDLPLPPGGRAPR